MKNKVCSLTITLYGLWATSQENFCTLEEDVIHCHYKLHKVSLIQYSQTWCPTQVSQGRPQKTDELSSQGECVLEGAERDADLKMRRREGD